MWEGPEDFTIILELGENSESLGAELPDETAYTQIIIDDPEDSELSQTLA